MKVGEGVNIIKRSLIYLQRNKKKTIIFLFILTLISTILMICISIWHGCHNEVKKLQKQYGKSFVVETLVGEDKIEYFTDEMTGLQMSYYTGPVVDNNLVSQILALDFVEYVCYESIHELVTFPDITFVPGLWANDLEKYRENPEEYMNEYDAFWNIEQIAKENTIRGYNRTEWCNDFQTNNVELIKGRHINEEDRYKVLISDTLAEKNQLVVGDIITAEINGYYVNGNTEEIYANIALEIVGIFHVNVNQIIGMYTPEMDILDNYMYTDFKTAEELFKVFHEAKELENAVDVSTLATFYINSELNVEGVIEKVKNIEDIPWEYYTIKINDSIYQSALKPLQMISRITGFTMIFILVMCIVILLLILKIWIKSRKREIGILLSLGETKQKIILQILIEGILVLTIALLIAIVSSSIVSNRIGNNILTSINEQNERIEEMKREKVEANKNNVPSEIEALAEFNDIFEVKTQIDVPDEIICQVTRSTIVVTGMIMIIVLVMTVWIGGRQILKLKLREILM